MNRYFISDGVQDLDVMVAQGVDMDGTFEAICVDTGETLRINGWQADTIVAVNDDAVTL